MRKCANCGANLVVGSSRCDYCGLVIADDFSLELDEFIQYIQNKLVASKGKYDRWIFLSFVVFSCIWGWFSWIAYTKGSWVSFLLILVVSGGVCFVAFGFTIIYLEMKSVREVFQRKIQAQIKNYLFAKGISELQFESRAQEILESNSFLVKLITENSEK